MAKKRNDNSMHWIIGIVLLITGILIIAALVVSYSQAEDVNGNVNINNSTPVIDTANAQAWEDPGDDGSNTALAGFLATPGPTVTHTLAGNTNIIVKVNVTDSNGWAAQPVNMSARLVATSGSGSIIAVNFDDALGADVLVNPSASETACDKVADVSNVEQTWLCGVNMPYNALATTASSPRTGAWDGSAEHWRMLLRASDGTAAVNAFDDVHYEFALQIGLNSANQINLGPVVTDGTPGTQQTLAIYNIGNQQIDFTEQTTETTDAAAWTCVGTGNPLISDIHVGKVGTDTNYNAMDPLNVNGGAFTHTDFDRAAAGISTIGAFNNVYFQMATTQAISPGTCTLSSIVLTAIKGF